jgi:hypothetical protein
MTPEYTKQPGVAARFAFGRHLVRVSTRTLPILTKIVSGSPWSPEANARRYPNYAMDLSRIVPNHKCSAFLLLSTLQPHTLTASYNKPQKNKVIYCSIKCMFTELLVRNSGLTSTDKTINEFNKQIQCRPTRTTDY